jgi:branched-chain amino acid transport system ATP-binding protein
MTTRGDFERWRLFKGMLVLENFGRFRAWAETRTAPRDGYASWVGLAYKADKRAGVLAYTDQRRLGISRASVVPPAFILSDEPAAGMSEAECEYLMLPVKAIPSTSACCVLLIEHNMRVMMGVSSRIHVLDGSRTLAEGAPADIQRNQAVVDE